MPRVVAALKMVSLRIPLQFAGIAVTRPRWLLYDYWRMYDCRGMIRTSWRVTSSDFVFQGELCGVENWAEDCSSEQNGVWGHGVEGQSAGLEDCKVICRDRIVDISLHSVVAASASTEHALHLLLHKAAVSSSYYDDTSHAVSAVSTTSKPKLVWSPLILKSDRPEAEQHITNLESSIGRGQGGGLDLNSAKIVRCWALYHVGAVKDCLQALADVDKIGLRGDNGEGYDQVLRVIANAIEGESRYSSFERARLIERECRILS